MSTSPSNNTEHESLPEPESVQEPENQKLS